MCFIQGQQSGVSTILGRHRATADDLRDERLAVGLIVAFLVTGLVVAQAALLKQPSTANALLPLLQGPAVALYGLVLSVCIDTRRGLLPGALFVVIGASQPAWVLGLLMGLDAVGLPRSAMPDGLWHALPFAATGLAFAPIVWLATRAWWNIAIVLIATAASAWTTGWGPAVILGLSDEALGLTLLHLSLCWTLTAAVFARTWRIVPQRPTHCPQCGYPRQGLRENICPECGQPLDSIA